MVAILDPQIRKLQNNLCLHTKSSHFKTSSNTIELSYKNEELLNSKKMKWNTVLFDLISHKKMNVNSVLV